MLLSMRISIRTAVAIVALLLSGPSAWALPYTIGNVFVSSYGTIYEYTPAGVLVQTLNTTHAGEGDGMAFDASRNLYATAGFSANTVVKFDNNGTLVNANFGSGFNSHPESIVIDNTNNFIYVGQPDGNHDVLKFDLSGNLLGTFDPGIQNRGTDWIDLESDLHTLRYTSEGNVIHVYDLATSAQLPDFGTLPSGSGTAYAHRILSDGGDLVAATNEIVRFDSSGAPVQTYTIPNTSLLFAINLDPDGQSFWTADYYNGNVFEVNISTGVIEQQWTSAGRQPWGGLAVFGEICQTCGGPTVPEPATLALFAAALAGLGLTRRRKSA